MNELVASPEPRILMVGGKSRAACRRRDDEGGGAGDRGRAKMVGGLAESGVWATCYGDFTIVYRHRSTEWPVPYTDSHTPGAHEVIERVKELSSNRKEEGERKKEREKEEGKGIKENTIDKDCEKRSTYV
ncbi:hypothetical protein ALC53_02605 [Atta colombica]|uniref:Uncharacterized protein n=1 Tax=Atta colombica TaxID=520822 RepID=A0A195BS47_9HYME|nr:hypothetical protein ALC53_02605 [Atta colombica]